MKTGIHIESKTDGKKLKALMKRLEGKGVKAGILSGTGEHPNAEAGQTIAEIAFWNEYGTRNKDGSVRIPERSFVRSTIAENNKKYFRMISKLLKRLINGTMTSAQAQAILGQEVMSDIQNKINSISEPPNAPETIDRKGFDNPLVHTAALKQHISWGVA